MKYDYTVLDVENIELIHQTSLRVLNEVGMHVFDDDLCATLAKYGLTVDQQKQLVRFPPEAVGAALKAAPSSFFMYDHKGNKIAMQNGNTLPAVYSNAIKVWDWESKQVRYSTLEDLTTSVRLADAIPEIAVVCPVCAPSDVAQEIQMATAIVTLLENSSKLTEAAPHDGEEAVLWTEATAIADQDLPAGSGPTLMFTVSPTSPLQIDPNTCEVMKHGIEQDVPLLISPCPMGGATSPITMAGTAVQTHAEFLGMLTVSQLLKAGMPVIYGGSAGPMDLRRGTLAYGAPERNNILSANIDIANYFNLPHFSSAGTVDSALPDFQAGGSKALAWLTRMMKGTILGIWFGSILTGSTVAPEQIILDVDLYLSVLSMLKGISTSKDHLSFEAIKRVGPGGNFLVDAHTRAYMRSDEYYASPIVNHDGELGKNIIDRAHDRVQKVVEGHTPSVSENVVSDLKNLLEKFSKSVL